MKTTVTRQSTTVIYSDSPGVTIVEILTIPLGKNPTMSNVKTGLQLLNDYVKEEVSIDSPNSPYDCTGKSFTSSLDLVKRWIEQGTTMNMHQEEQILVAIYNHYVRCDV